MKAKIPSVKHERLLEVLSYDCDTGEFRWLANKNQKVLAGQLAGTKHHSGYLYIRVDGEKILAHRLAWFYLNEEWAAGQIDHIDGNKLNNSAENLRETSQSVNSQNQKRARKDNSTGMLGVSSSKGKFAAQINIGGKNRHIGYFGTKEQAHEAYLKNKRIYHAGCTI